MVCVPCLALPAFLFIFRFLYQRIEFIRNIVHYFFPSVAVSYEEGLKQQKQGQQQQSQEDFFKSDSAPSSSAADIKARKAAEAEDAGLTRNPLLAAQVASDDADWSDVAADEHEDEGMKKRGGVKAEAE